jgi:4-nitrophenyl phosphatase
MKSNEKAHSLRVGFLQGASKMAKSAALIDLDGTLYNGEFMISYADTFIERLRAEGVPFLFLTNNSSRTPEAVAQHLCELGIVAKADEVYNSAQAAASYVRDVHGRREPARIFCIGETGLYTALADAGAQLLTCEQVDAEGIVPDFVVQGIDRRLTYEKLRTAVQSILAGATFILTNPDLLLPWNRQFVPGAGSIGAMLEAASGVQPVVIGKPSAIIMRYALQQLQTRWNRPDLQFGDIWMIGDNLRTDIAAAQAVGAVSTLVLTGLVQADRLAESIAQTGVQPQQVFDGLKSCADAFLTVSDNR